ncbi:MAG: hypothetical protein K8U57_05925 [Planctomycetes bacterium]|nr:hypothetical protein [Planctomycetota bacterium]
MTAETYNPMRGTVSQSGTVPCGGYQAVFKTAEYLPEHEGDMEGKGKRQFPSVRFNWEISDGEHKGKLVNTETSTANSVKSRQYTVISWLLGRQPTAEYDLSACVGKKYLVTVGNKPNKNWVEVTQAMLSPNQS